jgi:hypothetical protein
MTRFYLFHIIGSLHNLCEFVLIIIAIAALAFAFMSFFQHHRATAMAAIKTKIGRLDEVELIAEFKDVLLPVERGEKLGLWTQGKGGRHFESYRVIDHSYNAEMDKDGNLTNLTRFVAVVTEKEYQLEQMKQK